MNDDPCPICNIMVCESMVYKYLPSMRAEMVTRLIQQQGLSQSDAARKLGLTRAAVSQYLNKKRGGNPLYLSPEMDALIDRWALAVVGEDAHITLCDVCRCATKKT